MKWIVTDAKSDPEFSHTTCHWCHRREFPLYLATYYDRKNPLAFCPVRRTSYAYICTACRDLVIMENLL